MVAMANGSADVADTVDGDGCALGKSSSRHVLVTGGAGYIGSHTTLELILAGHDVTVVDNLDNASPIVLDRIGELANAAGTAENVGSLVFEKVDLLDGEELDRIFAARQVDAVIHFAGLKAVGESVKLPLMYYHNNITGTLKLLETMKKHNCNRLVFSSSATVYGEPETVPVTESFPLSATNPYGRTKLFIEEICRDVCKSEENITDGSGITVILLRYFNPVGAHPSGRLGEDPKGFPNNLMPYVQQVAVGRRQELTVFGDDYKTIDGTGVRDYIHVMDLAYGHIAALEKAFKEDSKGCYTYNLGTGRGTSVLELVKAFGEAAGKEIPFVIGPKRPGDVPEIYARTDLAEKELGWKATRTIEDMCRDQWNWASNNPHGYEGLR